MTNREKIMVAAAFLSVLYGIYFNLQETTPDRRNPVQESAGSREEITKLQTELYTDLAKVKLAEDDIHLVTLLTDGKESMFNGPFLALRPVPSKSFASKDGEKENAAPEKKPELEYQPIYSGFIESDGRQIAILDGMEYEIGEQLTDDSRVKIQRIEPAKVVLEFLGALFPISIETVEDPKENFITIGRERSGQQPGAGNGE